MTTPGNTIATNEQAHSSDGRVSSETARRIQDTPVNDMNQQPASFPRADISNGYRYAQQPRSLAHIRNALAEIRDSVQSTIETLQEALEDNDEDNYYDMFIRNDSGDDEDEDEDEDDDPHNNNDDVVEAEVHDGNEVRPVFPVQTNQPRPSTILPLTRDAGGNPNLSEAYAVFEELSAEYERFMQGIEEHGFPNKRRKSLNEEVISDALTKKVYQPPSLDTEPPCCSICLEDFLAGELLGILNCSHSYHDKCIQEWLLKDNSCPLCRTKGVTI